MTHLLHNPSKEWKIAHKTERDYREDQVLEVFQRERRVVMGNVASAAGLAEVHPMAQTPSGKHGGEVSTAWAPFLQPTVPLFCLSLQ